MNARRMEKERKGKVASQSLRNVNACGSIGRRWECKPTHRTTARYDVEFAWTELGNLARLTCGRVLAFPSFVAFGSTHELLLQGWVVVAGPIGSNHVGHLAECWSATALDESHRIGIVFQTLGHCDRPCDHSFGWQSKWIVVLIRRTDAAWTCPRDFLACIDGTHSRISSLASIHFFA